jgi:hypothetical protein
MQASRVNQIQGRHVSADQPRHALGAHKPYVRHHDREFFHAIARRQVSDASWLGPYGNSYSTEALISLDLAEEILRPA